MTEGFGLYPTIVNPPYTTLTAYDLNAGTIKWQIGLGDDLRLVGQGIKGTGTAATIKGGIIADRDRAGVRHRRRPQGPRLRQRDRQADLRSCRSAARRAARRRCTSSAGVSTARHRSAPGGQRGSAGSGGGSTGGDAAAPAGIIAYAQPGTQRSQR